MIGRSLVDTQSSDLRITNGTGNLIRYLLVETYEDKYVLFDVEPGAVVSLGFQFIGQLSCQGEFAESKRRFGKAVRLVNDEDREVKGSFNIRVGENDIEMESPDLRLEQAPCCAVGRPGMYGESY